MSDEYAGPLANDFLETWRHVDVQVDRRPNESAFQAQARGQRVAIGKWLRHEEPPAVLHVGRDDD